MKIFSIFDVQAKYFNKPVIFSSRGEAIRAFTSLVTDPEKKSPHSQFPADFELYEIAHFSDETGVVSPLSSILRLGNGLDFSSRSN